MGAKAAVTFSNHPNNLEELVMGRQAWESIV